MDTTLLNALNTDGRDKFEGAINALQGDVSAAAARLTIDPRLRLQYARLIKEMSADLRAKANAGMISWEQAAREAQQTRNLIMDMVRARSTPLGRAMAERMKSQGKTFNELVAKKQSLCLVPGLISIHCPKYKKIKYTLILCWLLANPIRKLTCK